MSMKPKAMMGQDLATAYEIQRKNKRKKTATGGEVVAPRLMDAEPEDSNEHDDEHDIIAQIRKKIKAAKSGMVDLDENAMEEPNSFYDLNEDAALKENYDEDMDSLKHPEDSNEHGDEIDSDEHDMIAQIRKKIKAKRGM